MGVIERYQNKIYPKTYKIGDIGPSGGYIFITPSTIGNTTGKYFETAPSEYGVTSIYGGINTYKTWAQSTPVDYQSTLVSGADGIIIGTGYQNTLDIIAQGNNNASTSAAAYTRSLTINGKSDWFLPSYDELTEMSKVIPTQCWSSTEQTYTTVYALAFFAFGPDPFAVTMAFKSDATNYVAFPVRSFLPEDSGFLADKTQRIGNDSVYGTGSDGTVVIASNTSLTRDMYYSNLTINNGYHLNTNGFKVFVKNTLTINGSIGINAGVAISNATLAGTSNIGTSTTNSIGGSAAGVTYVASQASSSVRSYIENVLNGGSVDVTGVFNPFTGGAGGENGAAGTVTPATAGSGATAGGAGGAGALTRNAGVAGGPGTDGTPGTNGAAGTTPPAASAGSGARGGGVVAVIAKSISGSGSILSLGSHAGTGGALATGSGATNGAAGSAGSAAPAAHLPHHVQSHAPYRTGDGVHGPHAHTPAPALPSSHVPATSANHAHGSWIHTTHTASCLYPANSHGGTSPHTDGSLINSHINHTPVAPTSTFYLQGGIDHTAGGHLGHDGAVSHTYAHSSAAVGHNPYTQTDPCPDVPYKGGHIHAPPETRHRRDDWGHHANGNQRNAGASRTIGHVSKAGGSAGTAGLTGTNGTNGSTTAGTNGKSGGGGGIFIITDSTPTGVTTSVSGGTIGGVAASSGNVITILNA